MTFSLCALNQWVCSQRQSILKPNHVFYHITPAAPLQWFVFILLGWKMCVYFASRPTDISHFYGTYNMAIRQLDVSVHLCNFFLETFGTASMNQSSSYSHRNHADASPTTVNVHTYSSNVHTVDSLISYNIIFRFSWHMCSLFWFFFLLSLLSVCSLVPVDLLSSWLFTMNPTANA